MLNDIYDDTNDSMNKSIESLKRDYSTLRTGSVTTTIVDHIRVDYYGTPTALNQVGNVVVKDATTISINPWEKAMLQPIEKAIQEANIGVNPNNDGDFINLYFPAMSAEQRKEIVKQAKSMTDHAKVALRGVRKNANDDIKALEKAKDISEDDAKRGFDEIQKITDKYVALCDSLFASKEQDILKV
ncbi:Ribosome recycling factor [hydrothermal vent metagenome]|uniref:Ribosome recycling factor n=1 Tax=hydrothermal vent metagenome TaxID=652676 RepID=A0A1W1EIE4_9ZZZZ